MHSSWLRICISPLNFCFSVDSPQVPTSLYKSGGYHHLGALFGPAYYGQSIILKVYYADSNLCDRNVDTQKGYPVRAKDENGQMLPWKSPFILMVDRGGCTFVQKVRNAQKSGAAAVIISDNTCLCSAGSSCVSNPNFTCESVSPIMADDGSGNDIDIPSVLMFKQDADVVKAELMGNKQVLVEMSWRLSPISSNGRVEYEIWTTPKQYINQEFFPNFKDAAIALDERAYFTPHMYIYDGVKSGCRDNSGENLCYNLCTNNGRYCATDPDNNLDEGITGADVVAESLRRICIWRLYGQADGIGVKWWNYVVSFIDLCDYYGLFTNINCILDIFQRYDIDEEEVNQCMTDAGGLNSDNTNILLEFEIKRQSESGINIIPTVHINGTPIRGAFSSHNVLAAICSTYADDTPDICTVCESCPNSSFLEPTAMPSFTPPPSSHPPCTLYCLNGGICSYSGGRDFCTCPVGFSGIFCEEGFVQCSGGDVCLNGGKCNSIWIESIESEIDYCDCDSAIYPTPNAVLSCKFQATEICTYGTNKIDDVSYGLAIYFYTNGGICIEMVVSSEPHPGCICPDGFEGDYCEFIEGSAPWWLGNTDTDFMLCPDGHRCENGGLCIERPFDEGTYYCDCNASISITPLAGLYCEYKATVFCSSTISSSTQSFCTNGGRCVTTTKEGEVHKGCICPAQYQGEHCQYVVPLDEGYTGSEKEKDMGYEESCPDDLSCLNGGLCREIPLIESDYYCDCDYATFLHAGISCEHRATALCSIKPPYTSFCTNGGACIGIVAPEQPHLGCWCPEGFEGAFCQFSKVSYANPTSMTKKETVVTKMESWKLALAIILPVMAVVGLSTAVFLKFRNVETSQQQDDGSDV